MYKPGFEIAALIEQIARAVIAELPASRAAVTCAGAGGASRAAVPGLECAPDNFAQYFDHTLLKPDAMPEQVAKLCSEAREYGFASVCVNPTNVRQCSDMLHGSKVRVCSVVGFPFGATHPEVKAFEARMVILDGADEVDMVINVGALKAGLYGLVQHDIESIVCAAHPHDVAVKVIIEAASLSDDEKVRACSLAMAAGADFVKTSTGFGPGGATTHDVALMRKTVGQKMGVKAAGGIRDYDTAMKMIEAGASRIGASASVAIMLQAAKAGSP